MDRISFGEYLRQLRCSRVPQITQEELANAIGRKKMTISQFENNKNSPPQGELLENIISALSLSAEEEKKLRYLAALSRKAIPSDIADYFFDNPSICDAIRAAKNTSKDNCAWERIAEMLGNGNEKDS